MSLEPAIAGLVDDFIAAGRPSSRHQTITERRAGYQACTVLAGETETRVDVKDITLNGCALRVFSPRNVAGKLPAVVYYHGGCFVSGGFETHDNQLRQLCYHSGCRVIAVQYRLAPEYTWPAAHDDAEHAADTIWKNAELLEINRDHMTIAGDSAGGHIALVTALRLKSTGCWQPRRLILIYPMLDATAESVSYQENGYDYIITRDTLLSGYEAYMSDLDPMDAEASPLFREDFAGLPPVHIITAEYDPLRNEGEVLHECLMDCGVDSTCQRYLGVIHGFFQLGGISQAARDVMRDVAWRVGQ